MQEIAMKINAHAAQIAQSILPKQPPAQAARDLIKTQPDLANQSFGALVSRIARGETISSEQE
jgi:hypothetical protein